MPKRTSLNDAKRVEIVHNLDDVLRAQDGVNKIL